MEVFMSDQAIKNEQALKEQWPSLRDTYAPETAVEAKFPHDIHGTIAPETPAERISEAPIEPPLPPHEVLRRADAALDVARFEHRQAKQVVADARQRVQRALAKYNAVAPALTPEENVRQWIASNQARKARLARAGQIPYRPSVTETAKAMSGGGHGNDIRTRRGGGAAYRRGPNGTQAFTKTQAQTITAERIREARANLPSA
jgi:hypothetical protein